MDSLVDAVAASDSPYSILAIALIGIYVLAWRWGGHMLDLMRRNQDETSKATTLAERANRRIDSIPDPFPELTPLNHQHEELKAQLQELYATRVIGREAERSALTERLAGISRGMLLLQRRIEALERQSRGLPYAQEGDGDDPQ